MKASSTAILWLRRDLRLADHQALSEALASHEIVIPLFIDDIRLFAGAAQRVWLRSSLQALQAEIEKRGSRLIIRDGKASEVIKQLLQVIHVDAIYTARPIGNSELAVVDAVAGLASSNTISMHYADDRLLHRPESILTGSGTPYRVYGAFRKRLWELAVGDPIPAPDRLPRVPDTVESRSVGSLRLVTDKPWCKSILADWEPGENGADRNLGDFLDSAVDSYQVGRDSPAIRGTSRLSPHLALGEISPRLCWAAVHRRLPEPREAGAAIFLNQLLWREFGWHLLFHFPDTDRQPLNPRFKQFQWQAASATKLDAWQQGQTGVPLVDAGMRELWQTGWMHNRVRMVVASFLTKNLLINWVEGADWFEHTLVDIDVANNTLGWQWTAGCGADAAPFFRVFNPVRQAERFDAQAAYIRRWVPELSGLPDRFAAAPWLAKPQVLHDAGVRLGETYPEPMVDLAASRKRALAEYSAMRERSTSSPAAE